MSGGSGGGLGEDRGEGTGEGTGAAPEDRPDVVLVTGISGSGKSIALHALEDAGYFCVDNLPPELLRDFVRLERQRFTNRVAAAMDVRTASSLPQLVPIIDQLKGEGVHVRSIFVDASNDALLRRYSETRRPHPLTARGGERDAQRALLEAIDLERQLLADLRDISTIIDTSQLRPAVLRRWVRSLVGAREAALTLVFESFAYKHGVPLDADFVFDVRVLPNPYYVRELRPLTGRDAPVAAYLEAQPEAKEMLQQIHGFVRRWLPSFEDDQRSYLTVAIGCTGGQHRSVYAVEWLAQRFDANHATLVRHRELDIGE
jgi:RNase adapter protein RapZ